MTAHYPSRTTLRGTRCLALRPAGRAGPPARQPALRGRISDPAWVRPSLLALLVATAVLYLWGLGASGWANSFYSAAAQAGSESWKALFFGSSDAANSITVDKPPAALWVMALSVRIFGLSSWSILVPQALMGVAAVGLLYATVRRTVGPGRRPDRRCGAGAHPGRRADVPVQQPRRAAGAADGRRRVLRLVRALETGSTKWLVLAGVLVGFGFLTKMLQALLVVPAFALVYLVAAPNPVRSADRAAAGRRRRAGRLGRLVDRDRRAGAGRRPALHRRLAEQQLLELTLGYNGFGRLTGDETGSVGGGGGNGGGGGARPARLRLFDAEMGGQISWLLPAALILLVAGLWLTRRAARTDRPRAGAGALGRLAAGHRRWCSAYAQGIFHPYYTVALAPAIGARGRDGRRRAVAAPATGSPPPACSPRRRW